MSRQVVFKADRVRVSGPRVDESYTITFEVGEYEKQTIADLFLLPMDKVLKVMVEVENG